MYGEFGPQTLQGRCCCCYTCLTIESAYELFSTSTLKLKLQRFRNFFCEEKNTKADEMSFGAAIYYIWMTYAIKKMHRIQSIRDAALIAQKVLILQGRHLKPSMKNIYHFFYLFEINQGACTELYPKKSNSLQT